jgi:hypothetical protein
MNPVLLLALGVLAAASAWSVLKGDWLLRSWRSAVLVGASVAALPILGVFLEPPLLFLVWLLIAGLLWIPLVLRSEWVMSMGSPDGPLAKRVDQLQAGAAKASREFQAGRIDGASLVFRIASIRQEAALLSAPDAEWQDFLDSWGAELKIMERMARTPGDPNLSIDDARVIRAGTHQKFAELVAARASFWR